jgi:hypothetical protein
MERAAGFVYDDTPQAKLGKLNALLAHFSPNRLGRLAMEGAPSAICGRLLPNAEQATIPRSCIQPLAWSAHSPSSASAPRPSATSSTKQPVSLGAHSQASSHSSVGSELDDFEDELKEDADEHEDDIDPDVDEDENEPAPSLACRPDYPPHLLTNSLLPPLSLDEMKTNRTRIPLSQTLTHSDADKLCRAKNSMQKFTLSFC